LRPARPLELGLTVATSLAVFVVASEVMLAIGRWAPATATYAIAALALPAMATRIYRESDSNLGPRQRSNHKQGGL